MKQLVLPVAITVAAALLLGGAKANVTVRIRDLQYEPANVSVKVGDSVTWINADDRDHTVQAVDNSFNSGNLKPGQSFTFVFENPGSFQYECAYHPRMRGTVQVSK